MRGKQAGALELRVGVTGMAEGRVPRANKMGTH
jgi:hypothetical protein